MWKDWIFGKVSSQKVVESRFSPGGLRAVWMWHLRTWLVVALAVLGEHLDSMVFKGFSHLNISVILKRGGERWQRDSDGHGNPAGKNPQV